MSRDDSDVGGHTISELDFDEVTQHELLGTHVQLVAVSDDDGELNTHNSRLTRFLDYRKTSNSMRTDYKRMYGNSFDSQVSCNLCRKIYRVQYLK